MNSFTEIVERIKDIISSEVDGFVTDKDVADALGLHPRTLRMYKAADDPKVMPFKQLFFFCASRGLSTDWLFFGDGFFHRKIS